MCMVERCDRMTEDSTNPLHLSLLHPTMRPSNIRRQIASAAARLIAEEGMRVLVHYRRDADAAEAVLASLPGKGHATVHADLARPLGAERLAQDALALRGRIDVLVNNAGLYDEHPFTTSDLAAWQAAWRRTLALNLSAAADLCVCIGRHMIESGGGRIINVSSRGAFRGEPSAPAYGAARRRKPAPSMRICRRHPHRRVRPFPMRFRRCARRAAAARPRKNAGRPTACLAKNDPVAHTA